MDKSRFYKGPEFDLDYGCTFNTFPVPVSEVEGILEKEVTQAKKYGFFYAATEFWLKGCLGLITVGKRNMSFRPLRARIRAAENLEEEQLDGMVKIAYMDIIGDATNPKGIEPRVNIRDGLYTMLSGDDMHFNRNLLDFKIKEGDEFNVAVSKKGKEGDYLAKITSNQCAIIKESFINLNEKMKIRVKVMRARGTRYFVTALHEVQFQNRLMLQLTNERPVLEG